MTLTPQRLFNNITEVEELKTNYKDVNDHKIDFMGKTKATVKRNSGITFQLPLLITEGNITMLMGLDWMKRLNLQLHRNKKLPQVKINLEEDAKNITTKRKTSTNSLTRPNSRRNK